MSSSPPLTRASKEDRSVSFPPLSPLSRSIDTLLLDSSQSTIYLTQMNMGQAMGTQVGQPCGNNLWFACPRLFFTFPACSRFARVNRVSLSRPLKACALRLPNSQYAYLSSTYTFKVNLPLYCEQIQNANNMLLSTPQQHRAMGPAGWDTVHAGIALIQAGNGLVTQNVLFVNC
jgi:hypothetical protein